MTKYSDACKRDGAKRKFTTWLKIFSDRKPEIKLIPHPNIPGQFIKRISNP